MFFSHCTNRRKGVCIRLNPSACNALISRAGLLSKLSWTILGPLYVMWDLKGLVKKEEILHSCILLNPSARNVLIGVGRVNEVLVNVHFVIFMLETMLTSSYDLFHHWMNFYSKLILGRYWKLSTKVPVFFRAHSKESEWEVLPLRIRGT